MATSSTGRRKRDQEMEVTRQLHLQFKKLARARSLWVVIDGDTDVGFFRQDANATLAVGGTPSLCLP